MPSASGWGGSWWSAMQRSGRRCWSRCEGGGWSSTDLPRSAAMAWHASWSLKLQPSDCVPLTCPVACTLAAGCQHSSGRPAVLPRSPELSSALLSARPQLDVMKFICKEFWAEVFRKSVDNLRTNHRWGPLHCSGSASCLLQGMHSMTAAHQGRDDSCLFGSLLCCALMLSALLLPIMSLSAAARLCCETRSSGG